MAINEILVRWYEYTVNTNNIPQLKELRDWVEKNAWGFGDRPLYWMWYEIIKDIPDDGAMIEIGVYKGQTLALWRMISDLLQKDLTIIGISPLESTTDQYHIHEDANYIADIQKIHDQFNLKWPILIKGYSQAVADKVGGVDAVFIDGSHDYDDVVRDFKHYVPKTKKYLVVDDASCNKNMLTDEVMWYKGLEDVSQATDEWYNNQTEFKEVNVVGHNRVFKR